MIDKKSLQKEIDYIIVGQGLAGSFLSYHLLQHGQRIRIFGSMSKNSSSQVAAGLFNPVTGKRNVLTWKANQLFPYLHHFYPNLEREFNATFYHPIHMYKLFTSAAEINDLTGKSTLESYKPFIHSFHQQGFYAEIVNDFLGGVELKQTGYVNTNTLLKEFRKYFVKNQVYNESFFDTNSLILDNEKVSFKELIAKKVIYCEGPEAVQNKYFNWLPFNLVKGELLDIECDHQIDMIINKDIFILPLTNKIYRVGATYDRENIDNKLTDKGRNFLINRLEKIIKSTYTVKRQSAGIRPASKDRRPFLGLHPEFKTLGIFNGLGSKGISLAPYLSEKLTNYLIFNEEIDHEVNIFRYYQLYK